MTLTTAKRWLMMPGFRGHRQVRFLSMQSRNLTRRSSRRRTSGKSREWLSILESSRARIRSTGPHIILAGMPQSMREITSITGLIPFPLRRRKARP